jgi:hypothetical protein
MVFVIGLLSLRVEREPKKEKAHLDAGSAFEVDLDPFYATRRRGNVAQDLS